MGKKKLSLESCESFSQLYKEYERSVEAQAGDSLDELEYPHGTNAWEGYPVIDRERRLTGKCVYSQSSGEYGTRYNYPDGYYLTGTGGDDPCAAIEPSE